MKIKKITFHSWLFLSIVYCFLAIKSVFGVGNQKESLKENEKIIYIHPGQWGDIFAIDNPIFNRDNCLDPVYRLREEALKKGYTIKQTHSLSNLNNFEYLFVFEIPLDQLNLLKNYPKEKLILFLWEPPSVASENYNKVHHKLFSKIYTWHDDLVDNIRYYKLYYPVSHPMIEPLIDFNEKKFSTMIACNKQSLHPDELYSKRIDVIRFFESQAPADFDLYGKWWPIFFKTYKGPIEKKVDILKQYKFCFAYENIKGVPGYVTEKIFDCFHAGCVPIYWGAPNLKKYIPENCYILRENFETNESLYAYLKEMTASSYQNYLNNIRSYLLSKESYFFTAEYFIETMINLIQNGSEKTAA